jgi:ferredoxin
MRKEDVPADAEDWNGVPNKLEEHFSEKPGKGD